MTRYRNLDISRFFRGDAAFAKPGLYEYLEAEDYCSTSATSRTRRNTRSRPGVGATMHCPDAVTVLDVLYQ